MKKNLLTTSKDDTILRVLLHLMQHIFHVSYLFPDRAAAFLALGHIAVAIILGLLLSLTVNKCFLL